MMIATLFCRNCKQDAMHICTILFCLLHCPNGLATQHGTLTIPVHCLQSVEKRLGKEAREHIADKDYMPLGTDLVASVKRDVQVVKDFPAIPNDTPVHGFIYDVTNGSLKPVVSD